MTPRDENDTAEDFGYHYDRDEVQMAWIGLKIFHQLPYEGGWFDQPYHLLMDILTYDRLSRLTNDDIPYYPNDIYEDQSIEDIKRMML